MFERNGNSKEETLILKNLDIMAYQEITSLAKQQEPSIEKALTELASLQVRDQQNKQFELLCSLQEFKKYGPGVYLVFKFMKYLLFAMALALPFPLSNMIILVASQDQYDDTNIETILQATTINGITSTIPLVTNFNFIALLILTINLIYWRQNEAKLVFQCTQHVCMPSYFTVLLTRIPNSYTQKEFKEYLQEKYGRIHQIYTIKNYHDELNKYKKIHEIIEQFKQERDFYVKNKATEDCLKLTDIFLKYREAYHRLNDSLCDQKIYEPYSAFVTFENCMQKCKLLEDQQQKIVFKSNNQVKEEGVQFVSCEMEPDAVAWQNLNISKRQMAVRCCLIALLLFLFLFLSITIIFIFVAAESGLYLDAQSQQLTLQQIIKTNQTQILQSYCLQQSYSKFHHTKQCHQFRLLYKNYCILFIMFPIAITILKMIFAQIMKMMVSIRRHKNSFEKIEWQIIIISVFYFIKAALIKFVIYRDFTFGSIHIRLLQVYLPFLIQLKGILPINPEQIQTFSSFSGQWIAHTSHKIIMIAIISFNFTIVYHFLKGLLSKKFHQYQAKRMRTQIKINKMLKGEEFQLEIIYSEVIALFLFCMMYFSCMPIVYILVFASLFMLYWTSKYSFIRFCRKPKVYAHGINGLAVKIIFIGVAINCIVSPMYFSEINAGSQVVSQNLFQQLLSDWKYLVLLIIITGFLIAGDIIVRYISRFYHWIRTQVNPRFVNDSFRNKLKQIKLSKEKVQSYSMHENEEYKEILQTLFLINQVQINKIGYNNHSQIEDLKKLMHKSNNKLQLFYELKSFLKIQHQQTLAGSKNCNKAEKYIKILKIMNQIEEQVQKQKLQLQKQQDMNDNIRRKIRNVDIKLITESANDNITSFKTKMKSQISQDMKIQAQPLTQCRFH